jgi:TetR/AcrR family transcriptional repressor of nem operon
MPREKDFNQSTVIKKCTLLFANNGYSATGIQEIVESSGINRSSLYSTFKGKEELFLTCLQVASKEEVIVLEELKKKSNGLKFIDSYLAFIIKTQHQQHLFKFATAEFKLLNKKTQSFINSHYNWRYNFLLNIIQEAQKEGKISKKIEAKDLTGMLELTTQGIQNLSSLANAEKLYKKSALEFSSLIKKKK